MIYLDRSATTPLCPEARAAMLDAMDRFGNPSSLHSLGVDAEHILTDARRAVLSALGVQNGSASELVFTSSGTEANSLAVLGVAHSKPVFRGKRIITTADEHPSVLEPMKLLESEGFEVVRIPCPHGVFDFGAFTRAMTKDVFLISVMSVNNETGAINDTAKIFFEAKKINPNAIAHTDAVQAFGKLAVMPRRGFADLVSVSAHKIGGPKGAGALYVSPQVLRTKSIVPFVLGGGQEKGLRSGTENTIGVAGFGAAAALPRIDAGKVAAVRERIVSKLPAEVTVNTPRGEYWPGVLSLTCRGIKSETMLHFLSSRGIFVSSGSACSSNGKHESYVLADFGLSPKDADCTGRLSFDASVTEEEADAVVVAISDGMENLQKIR